MAKKPTGELTLQTLAMPMNTNANGDIFGGWIVSQMDLAVGILSKKISRGRITTVAINTMTFLRPVHVGDIISCYAELIKIGTTSMTIAVEVWAMPVEQQEHYQVTEGIFVSVAIDEHGKPRQVSKKA
jgi:acyl-CoA thioesterase YciA